MPNCLLTTIKHAEKRKSPRDAGRALGRKCSLAGSAERRHCQTFAAFEAGAVVEEDDAAADVEGAVAAVPAVAGDDENRGVVVGVDVRAVVEALTETWRPFQ